MRYRDLKNAAELAVSQIELRVSDFDEDEPLEMQLSAAVMSASRLRFNIRVGPIAESLIMRYPSIRTPNASIRQSEPRLAVFRRATPKHLRSTSTTSKPKVWGC
jgi:hypothetical protein